MQGAKRSRIEKAKTSADATFTTRNLTPLQKTFVEEAVANHVESFNALVDQGLDAIVNELDTVEIEPPVGQEGVEQSIFIRLVELSMGMPTNTPQQGKPLEADEPPMRIIPRDCRVGHFTYSAPLHSKWELKVGDSKAVTCSIELGRVPVMVRSKACNLYAKKPKEMVRAGEDENEVGGYFLINGNERVIRMLVMPRSNYPMVIERSSYENRGPLYTKYATLFRGKRTDGSTQTNTLHYLRDGSCWLRFSHGREEWFIPMVAIMFCLHPLTDELFMQMLCGIGEHWSLTYLRERAMVMLQHQQTKHKLTSRRDAYTYLGRIFRLTLANMIPRRWTNEEVGKYLIDRFLLVHTKDPGEKLQTLCVMWQKLMGLVREQLEPDNQDTMNSHEILLPGQLYGIVLKESLEVMLQRVKMYIMKMTRVDENKSRKKKFTDFLNNDKELEKTIRACTEIDQKMEHFMATGNITSRSGLDLLQQSGYTIMADKLNFARFTSHFVAIHRGQYFMEMKTTTVRKLLPETFGFLCPVHTPDGSPCGLLNHLARTAQGVWLNPSPHEVKNVRDFLRMVGVEVAYSKDGDLPVFDNQKFVWVMLDGVPLGRLDVSRLVEVTNMLRSAKVNGEHGIPGHMEIVSITPDWKHLFPALFLFLGPGRLIRPVKCLKTQKTEFIGCLEQIYMNIACNMLDVHKVEELKLVKPGSIMRDEDIPEQTPVDYTHVENLPTDMFSCLAGLTPFSNHNQSPRNMYQCQMLKQTMGTAYHCHPYRSDNKVYKIQNPQKPIVRTEMYNSVNMDSHPQGCNAVVAVITYTGYDMEDSMIINKMSFERGFGHGIVYKTKIIEAGDKNTTGIDAKACKFTNLKPSSGGEVQRFVQDYDPLTGENRINDDGLPQIGILLKPDDPLCVWITPEGKPIVTKFHDDLPAYVENVTLVHAQALPGVQREAGRSKVLIKLRYPRNPIVGDKFSSRHGQKGVMSRLWPAEDMPFSESGVTPDILFNPHGFPSRMTIGMLIESIAAKGAAAEGRPTVDGTTFRKYREEYCDAGNNEDDPFLSGGDLEDGGAGPKVGKYFGSTLVKHGFQRLGTERLYSGVHGTEIETEIFMGVIYYQRLRHMVADKAQVRMRGPVDRITNQPLKGRQRHGGIRFGEMERDSLLAHGTSFLLHDRLMRSSDFDVGFVCPLCESILTPQANAYLQIEHAVRQPAGRDWECPPCTQKSGKPVRCYPMPIPWIFRYLTCELAAMNVRLEVKAKSRAREASLSTVFGVGA